MATANTVFIIYDTAGQPIAAIQPNTLNGPGGVQQSSDLAMFGLGYALWGQASDENDYRLLENFACPQSALNPTPVQPMGTAELGAGNGINVPIIGQLWFNTTTQSMYVFTSTGWTISAISVVSTAQPAHPAQGQLWYNTAIPQLEVWNSTAWVSVAALYLPLAGGAMTGTLNMNANSIIGVEVIATGTIQSTAYQAANGNTSNQITIPNSGATSLVDGPRIGPYVIYHTGNLPVAAPLFIQGMIMMWNSPVPPPGWALCNGGTYVGFGPLFSVTTPDLHDKFIVGSGGSLSPGAGGTGGAATGTGTTSSYTHSHGGTTQGTVLTLSQIPPHSHEVWTTIVGSGQGLHMDASGPAAYSEYSRDGNQLIQNSGGGTAHVHGINSDTHSHTVTVPTIPPYYGLYYIMKL